MLKHLCPECGKHSYSADENCFLPCPHCGVRFSGRYGSDRRTAERIKKQAPCVLHCKGHHLDAESTDISHDGLGIAISARIPVAVGEAIELTRRDLRIKAKIMWVNELPEKCLIGLQRIN